jgi:hypothetical protein
MILFDFNAYSNTANYILVVLDYTLAFRGRTPDAVLIQFNLLMMSKIARNMERIVINVYINNKVFGASSWYID